MADLTAWLTAQFNTDERVLRAAVDDLGGPTLGSEWNYDGRYVVTEQEKTLVAVGSQDWMSVEVGRYIAEHDPARVLREVDGKRQLLADILAERHLSSDEDTWYACASLTDDDGDPVCPDDTRAPGPCDCGRDARVARRLRMLALPFSHRPGYAEAIASL